MDRPRFIYVIHILTTQSALWDTLTDPAMSKLYWEHENVADWRVGGRWEHRRLDAAATVDIIGEVTEFDPPNRLAMTWFDPAQPESAEHGSKVAFDLKTLGEKVRLTVTHSDMTPETVQGASEAWAAIFSNLKTLAETGRPIPNPFLGIH